MSQPGFLSVKHASVWADVSVQTIQRWVKAGLPTYQGSTRGKLLIRPADIERFLQRRQAPQQELNQLVESVMKELLSKPS
jgi:predicted site-specific integrase-resolvase